MMPKLQYEGVPHRVPPASDCEKNALLRENAHWREYDAKRPVLDGIPYENPLRRDFGAGGRTLDEIPYGAPVPASFSRRKTYFRRCG